MDAAKQAISGFLHRGGKQDTVVDESVNPAITSETVKPHRHEETTEAVDREVHQDHYHTTVQPISHTETLPEKHTHNLAPQVEKTVHHGDAEQDRARAAAALQPFKDTSNTLDTTHSAVAAPTQVGEHVHHHVHEVVQPVIHKETIAPEVVHTVIPIHEKHLAPSEHHGLSTLPVKTMDEFKQLGTTTRGEVRHEEYEGHPKQYSREFQPNPAPVDRHPEQHQGTHDPVATGHFDNNSRRPSDSAATALEGSSGIAHGTGTGMSTATGTTGLGTGSDGMRAGGIDAFHGTPSGTQNAGLATGAAVGATAPGGILAPGHPSATGTNLTGTNVGSGVGIGSGSANPSQRGTHDAAVAIGASAAGTAIGSSTGHSDRGLGNTLGTTNRMEPNTSTLSHEGATTGALPSQVVEPSAVGNAPLGSESRDLYDEQAARPPVSGSHGTTAGMTAAGATAAGATAAGATSGGAPAHDATTGVGSQTTQSASSTGRKTKHGYTTSADLGHGSGSGKTKHGYTTGAYSQHGSQTGATTGATGGATSEATERASTHKQEQEPTNYEGGNAGAKQVSNDDNVQHASQQGEDPNLVETKGKWQGTGEPGSHSALFGLTPDGKTYEDTSSRGTESTKLHSTPAEEERKAASGNSKGETDDGSREGTRPEVAKQMHDPRVAEKGHDGQAEYHSGTGKPGSGA